MDTWLTSDPHFWHANVIKYCNRPFKDVEEMNEMLVVNWNRVVKPGDRVICLGDFSFSGRSVELYSHRLNGDKELCPGNHDPLHPYNKFQKKAVKQGKPTFWKEFYESHGWKVLPLQTTLDIPGVAVVNLSHMPYDTTDDRYGEYKAKDDGRWLLCGHIHQWWKTRGRMINVGVDVWDFTPVHIDQVSEIILKGEQNEQGT